MGHRLETPTQSAFARKPPRPTSCAATCRNRSIRANGIWARLRHLGARREELLEEHVAGVLTVRNLLECAWPAALETARQPFKSATWVATLSVVVSQGRGHDGGDLDRTAGVGSARAYGSCAACSLPS